MVIVTMPGERPHGDYVKYKAGCRCEPCRAANTAYMNTRTREMAYGRWQPYVDAGPARAHVLALRKAGLGNRQIATRSRVSDGCLSQLMYGMRGRVPSRRIRPETAQAILSVPIPAVVELAGGQRVDSTGTARRLQALVALGWPKARLARELGYKTPALQLDATTTTVANARAVRDLYDRLSLTPGPSQRARNYAAARRWVPPLAWDDDEIDDPAVKSRITYEDSHHVPDPVAVDQCLAGLIPATQLHPADRAEAIRTLYDHRLNDQQIAARLGCTSRTVIRGRDRLNLPTLFPQAVHGGPRPASTADQRVFTGVVAPAADSAESDHMDEPRREAG